MLVNLCKFDQSEGYSDCYFLKFL